MSWGLYRRPDRTLTVEFDAFADVFSGRRLETFITRAEALAAMARQRERDEIEALRDAGQPERLARGLRNGKHTKPEKTPRGEKHGQARLTDDQVRALRAVYASGVRGALKPVATSFGVSYHTAWDAASGRHWRHIS